MEKTIFVPLSQYAPTIESAALALYERLPGNYIPQSVRVVVTTANGLENTRGTVIPLHVGTIGAAQSPRPVLHPLDFEKAETPGQVGLVSLTYSVTPAATK